MLDRSIAEAVRASRVALAETGIDGRDAEILVAWASGRSLAQLQRDIAAHQPIHAAAEEKLQRGLARRLRREPLQHITGVAPFRHVELEVGAGVFTPRPETEVLVDIVLDFLRTGDGTGRVLDVGTGSGAIGITIAREAPGSQVVAVESGPAAYMWAKRNVKALAPRVQLVHADARDGSALAAAGVVPGSLSVVVSNPPYVPHASVPQDTEVHAHDPAAALYSGDDGLDLIRSLAPLAADLLAPGGLVAFEHAEDQGTAVRDLLSDAGFRSARTKRDLTGRDRVTSALR